MPISQIHKQKLKKNLILLAILLAWVAIIWTVTMLKIQEHGIVAG